MPNRIPNALNGTFKDLGYTRRPTFFGCNAPSTTPLVIYLPNYHAVAQTNLAVHKATYTVSPVVSVNYVMSPY